MRYLLAFLGLLWASSAFAQVGPPDFQVPCNLSVTYDASTNGATKLVSAASNSKGVAMRIYVCGYTIYNGGTLTTVSLVSGTKTTNECDTTQVALTPGYRLAAGTNVSDDSNLFRGLGVPAGKDLCILTNAGQPIQAIVYYVQF